MAKGNIYVTVPLLDIDNTLPTNLGKRYEIQVDDETTKTPTWREVAEKCKVLYGQPLLVEWQDGKKYIVIELTASFMLDEQNEIQALREKAGVEVGDKQSAPYARLTGEEVSHFLSTLSEEKISSFNDFNTQ